MEAVVGPTSLLIGQTPQSLHLRQNFEVNLLAVRETKRSRLVRLGQRRFEPGDVVVLQGQTSQLASALDRLALLPLAERNLSIARPRPRVLPLLILIAAIVLIACRVVTVELGFFVAATVTLLLRLITVREAYETIDWPVIVMLGCLIPVGESLRDTGAAALLADGLTVMAAHLSGLLAVGLILVVSMLVTPFLHHAAAVVAKNLGFSADPFLMAVAFGAACDFLTPIGHQNSTLVMRPAGYRFSDY